MATDETASWWNTASGDPIVYDADDLRRLDSLFVAPGGSDAFSMPSGRRVNGKGLEVTITGSGGTESVAVARGGGFIYDTSNAGVGGWRFVFPTSRTIALGARPGSGTSQKVLVQATITDPDSTIGSQRRVTINLKKSAASGSPATPSPDPLSLVLATLTVPDVGDITVSTNPARAVAAGGILPVADDVARDALVTAGVAYPGLHVYVVSSKITVRYDGTDWLTLQAIKDTGWIAMPTAPAGVTWVNSAAYRIKNGELRMRGGLTMSASGEVTTTIATLPAGARPSTDRRFPASSNTTVAMVVTVGANGVMTAYKSNTTSTIIPLDQIRFDLD